MMGKIQHKTQEMKPIRNQVLVKAFKGETITMGGIFVPDNYVEDGCKVEIVDVGMGTTSRPMRLRPKMIGYRVKDWGVPVEKNGEKFYLMEDSAILALEN